MLKILIADDEGIVIEALKYIIENTLNEPFVIESAKTGRQVIEVAERFRPDIAFMDIQMPGINGVKAMQEVRKTNKEVIFIIVSAYEKFDYAKDAISIGVLDYLNKPILKERVVEVLDKAIEIVKQNQKKRADELEIQEKLETVLPVIETGMIYSILFQSDFAEDVDNYTRLLGIEQEYGAMIVVSFGDGKLNGKLTNSIGTAVKSQKFYETMRSIIKEYTAGVVGPMMGNNIIVFIPAMEEENEYEIRIKSIDRFREMVRVLRKETGSEFRVGIGNLVPINEMGSSYRDALEALRESNAGVAHIMDIPRNSMIEEDYPVDIEKKLFTHVESGNKALMLAAAQNFFAWMKKQSAEVNEDAKLKCLEFVIRAEHIAVEAGKMVYNYSSRHSYLAEVTDIMDYDALYDWFSVKLSIATDHINEKKKENSLDIVDKAKQYILDNYRDISLDTISRDLNISPYYFSKLFKEKTGENFIDYVTDFKIGKAKDLLMKNEMSMKEICIEIGYANPNYFSYIFKKKVGVTPSEYREGLK